MHQVIMHYQYANFLLNNKVTFFNIKLFFLDSPELESLILSEATTHYISYDNKSLLWLLM